MRVKGMTLYVVRKPGAVLLGMKKRGFGEGKWNGFGGKIKDGETPEESVEREILEEVGIAPIDLRKIGELTFTFNAEPDEMLLVHVFTSEGFTGVPIESEEMLPKWFSESEIPFHSMWKDDPHWFPFFLAGKSFRGSCHFADESTIRSFDIQEVAGDTFA